MTAASLTTGEARTVDRARKALEGIWQSGYMSTEDLARDFGRLEIEARDLLEIIESLTSARLGGAAVVPLPTMDQPADRADAAGPDMAELRRLLFDLRQQLENGAGSVIEIIGTLDAFAAGDIDDQAEDDPSDGGAQ